MSDHDQSYLKIDVPHQCPNYPNPCFCTGACKGILEPVEKVDRATLDRKNDMLFDFNKDLDKALREMYELGFQHGRRSR